MSISQRTAKTIWGQCAGRCCICKKEVIYQDDGRTPSLVGEVAHIVGEKPAAARGDSPMSLEERDLPDNLLLLCREHHKIVDDDPEAYPVKLLHESKNQHLQWIAESLQEPTPWRSPIAQLTYINVPRLSELALRKGHRIDLTDYKPGQTLHGLGWELNNVMLAFLKVLSHLPVMAISPQKLKLHESLIGQTVALDRQRFRTKNVPMASVDGVAQPYAFSGDLSTDSHIYMQEGDFRVALLIDPTWITTGTAFMLFRSGQVTFSGFGRITNVDYEARIMTVTPWALGVPDGFESGFDEAIQDDAGARKSTVDLDGLVDMERAEKDAVYFMSPPTHCDKCGKDLSSEKYMIDGETNSPSGGWAFMCAKCFTRHGVKIGWGCGQLFLRQGSEWLEVAGFPPIEYSQED